MVTAPDIQTDLIADIREQVLDDLRTVKGPDTGLACSMIDAKPKIDRVVGPRRRLNEKAPVLLEFESLGDVQKFSEHARDCISLKHPTKGGCPKH